MRQSIKSNSLEFWNTVIFWKSHWVPCFYAYKTKSLYQKGTLDYSWNENATFALTSNGILQKSIEVYENDLLVGACNG